MAKIIKYNLCTSVNSGTDEEPQIIEVFYPVTMGWNEANEEIAKKEAYHGEYTIEDDGQPEPIQPETDDVEWDAMAQAIAEGVNDV